MTTEQNVSEWEPVSWEAVKTGEVVRRTMIEVHVGPVVTRPIRPGDIGLIKDTAALPREVRWERPKSPVVDLVALPLGSVVRARMIGTDSSKRFVKVLFQGRPKFRFMDSSVYLDSDRLADPVLLFDPSTLPIGLTED